MWGANAVTINRPDLNRLRTDRAVLVSALQAAGATINGQSSISCPFHDDKNPSGSLSQAADGAWRFRCFACKWNESRPDGDVFDVIKRARGLSFADAVRELGCTDATNDGPPSKSTIKPKHEPEDLSKLATECAARLQDDSELLDKLHLERGVDRETAKRFGVGVDARKRFWTFPVEVSGARGAVAIKHHRIRPDNGPKKCFWMPKGTKSRHCWPVCLDHAGPVWICPGELKALAVIATGRSAIGMTSGEGASLPVEIVEIVRGREVAIVGDDDDKGWEWRNKVQKFLADHAIDARIVNLPLDSSAGLNDVGDYIVSLVENGKTPDEIGATLDHYFEKSAPWAEYQLKNLIVSRDTWKPVEYISTGLTRFDELSGGGLRVGTVTLLVGPPGKGKTQVAVQIAHNTASSGISVGIISLEMTRHEITRLIVAQSASIPRSWLDKGRISGFAEERLGRARQQLSDAPLVVLDDDAWDGGLDRNELEDMVARGAKRYGWRLVVLDYLGLLAPVETDRTEFTTDLLNSTALKRVARQCNVAMIVVAALRKSNKATAKKDKAVTLYDVLGAGRLVYDAAAVWAVQSEQDKVAKGDKPIGIVKLRPLKSRFSGCAAQQAEVQLRWHPGYGSVCDLEKVEEDWS